MLHLEIARAEGEAEFYKKAAQHVEAALRLDVPLDARGERPLDVPLLQMRTKLALKTDIYRDAETAEEKAMLLLEQALYLPISPCISLYLPLCHAPPRAGAAQRATARTIAPHAEAVAAAAPHTP